MPIAFALAAAVALGTADFLGGVASRRSPALLIAIVTQMAGFILVVPGIFLLPGEPTREALLWGGAGGIFGALGLVVFFRALARGVMAAVSPVTAVMSATVPILAGVLAGERVSALAWVGLGVGVVAVGLVGWARAEAAERGALARSVGMALLAGTAFGLSLTCMSRAPHDSGAWPLAAARMCSLPVLLGVAAASGAAWRIEAAGRRQAIVSGILDMTGNALFLTATRMGELAIAAVVTAQYPAVTVLLSLGLLRERLHWRQLTGVALALAAVGLIAAR
jgi:drug/metabolite transporter (DMT)-like permease